MSNKNNPRISNKDLNNIKGSLRRAFARSELHQTVKNRTKIKFFDSNRPRVKSWSKCESCSIKVPTYTLDVDHKEPYIPVDRSFNDLTRDEMLDRLWCELNNLWAICEECHNVKTKVEKSQRPKRVNKKREKIVFD